MIVDMATHEIDDLYRLEGQKIGEIRSIRHENAKFLRKQQGKTSWDSYEVLLANERVMNERLTEMLLHKKHDLDSLWTEGGKNTYRERD